jgi:PEP-CTERM motif
MLLLFSGPLVPAVPAASTVVAYSYAGTLTGASPQALMPVSSGGLGIAVGDYVTGTFSYDSAQTGLGGVFNYMGSSKAHTFKVSIFTNSSMTTQLFTDSYSGNVTAFYRNTVTYNSTTKQAALAITGDTVYKSALGVSGPTNPAFQLLLSTLPNPAGFSPTLLPNPTTTTIKSFLNTTTVTPAPTLIWDPPSPLSATGLMFTARITEFHPGLNGVPEPSSVVLAGFGMAACGAVVVSRRRAGRARGNRTATPGSP